MTKPPKKLQPIKLSPIAPRSLLFDYMHKESLTKRNGERLIQYLKQLAEVARISEITTAELLDNQPLITFATKTFGLGASVTVKPTGRPKFWSGIRLFHLWSWVEQDNSSTVSQSLEKYSRRFDTNGSNPKSLNTLYYSHAASSPLVTFHQSIKGDPRVSNMADELITVIEKATTSQGLWPQQKDL